MVARRGTLRTLASLCAAVGALALWGAPAQALFAHKYLFQFNEVPSSSGAAFPGPVTRPGSMTVDAGHLWIAEDVEGGTRSRLDEFNAATGEFIAQPLHSETVQYLGVAVGHVSGEPEADVYAAEFNGSEASVGVYGEAGAKSATWSGAQTPAKSFGVVFDLTADNSASLSDSAAGDVYVPVPAQKVVDVFKPEAGGAEKYVTQLTGTCATPAACSTEQFVEPRDVAVSSTNGDVFVTDGNVVDVFEPTTFNEYAFVRRLTGTTNGLFEEVSGVTVDGSGDVYVIDNRGTTLGSGESPFVDQFSPSGVYLGQIAETSVGPFPAGSSLTSAAVDQETGDVYVGSFYNEAGANVSFVDVFGPTIALPDVTTEPSSEVTPGGASLNGTVNPAKAGAATCSFVYGTSTSFGQRAPCSKEVPEGESPVPVQAPVQLQPDTTYFYRLQASNANGTNSGEPGQDREFKTPGAGIHSEFASDAAATSVSFGATIDPDGAPTTYYFQYSTSDTAACGLSSCATAPAPPGASVGSGHGDSVASQYVTGLSPGTTYYYRVVALSELAGSTVAFYGPDQTFTTQAVGKDSALLDGRSWEMVSPPNKHGALLLGIEEIGVIQAAASGGAMSYLASSPIEAEPQGYTQLTNSQTLATRTSSGWVSRDIAIPNETSSSQAVGTVAEYPFFSEDLTRALVQPLGGFIPASSPQALAPGEASEQTAFLRTDYVGGDREHPCVVSCYRPLVTGMSGFANVPPGTQFGQGQAEEGPCPPGILCGPQFLGASPDARHVVLASAQVPLTEGSNARLYEWSEGKLTPISGIDTLGYAPSGNTSSDAGGGGIRRHTVSADGSRIIGMREEEGRHLYLRDMTANEDVMLDAVQGGSGANPARPVFQDASSDGSKIYFTDGRQLTADSRAAENAPDLYECEIVEVAGKSACKLSDLTVSAGGKAGGVLGVAGVSDDGSWVYFVANGVLAPKATTGTCGVGSAGHAENCNLYVRHDGTTQLAAILSTGDLRAEFGDGTANLSMRVSPDGRWMTFMSQRELTSYDNHDAITGTPDYEVYLYHAPSDSEAEAGKLVCASCNPTGARPVGVEIGDNFTLVASLGVWTGEHVAANLPLWMGASLGYNLYQPRYLSDNGRLFFNSSDALVPQDVNGNEDVYEYEPVGYTNTEGDVQCTSGGLRYSERSGGCVGLVSSGGAAGESAFLDASESGGDVFFLTSGQLEPQDYDTALDVYDAHECTIGVPCLPAPAAVSPPCDTGDSCKASPSPQPAIYGAPASATFSGAGNLAPPPPVVTKKTIRCPKGKKLSHGRCVRAKAKHKKAHKAKKSTTNRRAKR
jgi:hypothetical protein